jgi:hypothetical protein
VLYRWARLNNVLAEQNEILRYVRLKVCVMAPEAAPARKFLLVQSNGRL